MAAIRRLSQCVLIAVTFLLLAQTTKGQNRTQVVELAGQIRQLIVDKQSKNSFHYPLLGGFVRLSFHDCTGGCDGCIDMNRDDNKGLKNYIDELDTIQGASRDAFSQADFWALAGWEAAKFGASVNKNCTLRQSRDDGGCNGEPTVSDSVGGRKERQDENQETLCTPDSGILAGVTIPEFKVGRVDHQCNPAPARLFPDAHGNTDSVTTYFSDVFGFNDTQTVCIMGAHSLGRMCPANSGYDGPWTRGRSTLDNDYYTELFNGWSSTNDTVDGKWQWVQGQGHRAFLNADMALRSDFPVEADGRPNCRGNRNGIAACDDSRLRKTAEHLANSPNDEFLQCFFDAFNVMIENGNSGLVTPS